LLTDLPPQFAARGVVGLLDGGDTERPALDELFENFLLVGGFLVLLLDKPGEPASSEVFPHLGQLGRVDRDEEREKGFFHPVVLLAEHQILEH